MFAPEPNVNGGMAGDGDISPGCIDCQGRSCRCAVGDVLARVGYAVSGIVQNIRGGIRHMWNEFMGYYATADTEAGNSDINTHGQAKPGFFASTSSFISENGNSVVPGGEEAR